MVCVINVLTTATTRPLAIEHRRARGAVIEHEAIVAVVHFQEGRADEPPSAPY